MRICNAVNEPGVVINPNIDLNNIQMSTLYGVPRSYGIIKWVGEIIRIIGIPILLIVGLITIIKNKKMSKTSKIIISIIAILIAIILFFII